MVETYYLVNDELSEHNALPGLSISRWAYGGYHSLIVSKYGDDSYWYFRSGLHILIIHESNILEVPHIMSQSHWVV